MLPKWLKTARIICPNGITMKCGDCKKKSGSVTVFLPAPPLQWELEELMGAETAYCGA